MTKCLHVPRIDHCGECPCFTYDIEWELWECTHKNVMKSEYYMLLDSQMSHQEIVNGDHMTCGIPDGCPLDDAEEVGDE